jgi:VanZ family protein
MQYRDELLIRKNVPVKNNHFEAIDHQFKTMELELPHMFKTDQPVAFTITSDPNGAVAYRDAVRVGASPPMKLSCADFSGQLVLGDSPVSDNPWRGSVLDLSVYNSQLSAQSISNLFSNSAVNQPPEAPANNENLLAHYGFSEGSGKIIHNIAGPAPDLHIPDHFQIIHKQFLISPWQETPDKLALRDISINIFGFVPFGFLLFAYLSQCLPSRRAAVLTVIAGFAISLTIEVLQVFIPARASGITDIITNTFGAYLGMLLFRVPFMQTYAARMRTYSPPEPQAPRR